MKIPTETERAHLYTQLANALDTRSAEFIVGLFPSDQDDRLATHKDLQILEDAFATQLTEKIGEAETRLNNKIGAVERRLTDKIDTLSTRLTGLLIAVLIAVIGAMAAVYFAP